MSGSLSKKVGSSVILLFIRKMWSNLINLLVMTILARILTKEDFGVLTISAVLLTLINTVGTSGLAEYLIYYDKEDVKKVTNSVFWLNLFLTITVSVLVLATGPFWASFYGNTTIQTILVPLVITFFFEMLSMVPRTLLRKELQYDILVKYSTVFMTLVSIGKVGCAFAGAGVYSLVLPQAVLTPFLALALFMKTAYRPTLDIGKKYYRSIIGYSKHLLGGRLLSKLVNDGDNLIVGKFLGLDGLGVYNLAFQLANLITANVILVVNDVVLPVLSKVKSEPERLRKVFRDILGFLGMISFPLITALAVFADPVIDLIYGNKWSEAVLPLQILCLFAIGRSINSPSSLLYNAVGRPDVGFWFSLCFTPIFLVGVFVGCHFGIIGVAIATSLVRFGGQMFSTRLAFSLAGITSTEFYITVLKYLVLSVAAFILFTALVEGLENVVPNVYILLLAPVFIYFYTLILRIIDFEGFRKSIQFIGSQKALGKMTVYLEKIFFVKV